MNELEYFSTRLPKEVKKQIKLQAVLRGTNVQSLVEEIFVEWLKNNSKDGK